MRAESCLPSSQRRAAAMVCAVLPAWLVAVSFCSGCAVLHRDGSPFSTPFGVTIGDFPATAEQVDAIGPVWYMDYRWDSPTLEGHERLYVVRCWEVKPDRGAIASAMVASGSAWWSLGNEPNDPNQDNVSAEEYAELYYSFEGWAKEAPRCRIATAGIGNADWMWAEAFREAFRDRYGRYPRVDAWNIHNYMLEADLDPYDVAEFKRRIVAFRRWMESIGDGHKPLFLTEFGVLYGSGCCGRPIDPRDKIHSFMRDTVRWLRESDLVSCWAWFVTYSDIYNGSLLTREGQIDDLGMTYRDLVREL
jgi:hypothetical protein